MSLPEKYEIALDAERAVVGACIISSEALAIVSDILKPADFGDYNTKTCYTTILDMYAAEKPVDAITLAEELKVKSLYGRLGGDAFINGLMENVSSTANVAYHAEIVRNRAIRRKLYEVGWTIHDNCYDTDKPVGDLIAEAEKLLMVASLNQTHDDFIRSGDIIEAEISSLQDIASTGKPRQFEGYITRYTDLDRMLGGGFQSGSLNILAARPSMGKTALAMNIAQFGRSEHDGEVLVFSLEMPAEQIMQRMLAAEGRVPLSYVRSGALTVSDYKKVLAAGKALEASNLYISDATTLSATDFRSRCRRFKMRHPDLSLIVVDYLQLMTSDQRRTDNRQQEVSDISRMLKAVARELNCPVLALSQLSREADKRTDKKPQLSDLRDSGAIEQDADTVMMLFREDYYSDNENNDMTNSKADLRVAKNRNGTTGVVSLTFDREITRFFNHGEE